MGRTRTIAFAVGLTAAVLLTACGHKDHPTSTGSGTPTSPTAPPTPPAEPPTPPGPQTCVYAAAADPDDFERDGGDGRLTISTAAGCKWTIKSDASWVAVEGPAQGEGPATLKTSVEPNADAQARRVTLAIADTSVAISQPGQADCTFQVSPVISSIPRTPWTAEITVATNRGCRWTATSDAPWLHLRAAGASGSGTLTYDADFNPATTYAAQRLGVIAVRWNAPTAGQNVRINQWSGCNVALAAPPEGAPGFSGYPGGTVTVGPAGGRFHLFVLTDPCMGCAWTVESNDTWLSVDSPRLHQVQAGDGDLYFTVPANPSTSSRRAVLTVGERPLTIVQHGR